MTEENRPNLATESGAETTLVTPIFDDKAAETAQPVVPLPEAAIGASPSFMARTARRFPGMPTAAGVGRPSWMLGLIIASVLVGSLLGGLGLSLYQKRQRAAANATTPAPAVEQTAPVADDVPAPAVAQTGETATDETPREPSNILISERAEIPAETAAAPEQPATSDERAADAKKPEKESRSVPVVERKRSDDDDERARKDKDREREERAPVTTPRPRRTQTDAPRVERENDVAHDDARPRARMVDSITIEARRLRRQERRRGAQLPERRTGTVDRVRGIFEGQSPR